MTESEGLTRVSFAPSKNAGWSASNAFSRASSGTMFSSLPQASARQEWTLIFSVQSHSTPQVKPKPPFTLARAERRLRNSDQVRPRLASRSLSCVSL